jgi:hypothetical protein
LAHALLSVCKVTRSLRFMCGATTRSYLTAKTPNSSQVSM